MTIEATTDGDVFRAYLEHDRNDGAQLRYLPPDSPDFNPIEMC
jgi:hypothetical protein